jgi:hypothetical protein
MQRTRLTLLALLMAFACGALAPTVASAYEYAVQGETVGEGVVDTYQGGVGTLMLTSNVAGAKVDFECIGGSSAVYLEEEGRSGVVIKPQRCYIFEIKKGSKTAVSSCATSKGIELEFAGALSGSEGAPEDLLQLEGGESGNKIEVTGASCVLKGTYKITGSQRCSVPEGEREGNHKIVCTSTGSAVKLSKEEATLFLTLPVGLNFHIVGKLVSHPSHFASITDEYPSKISMSTTKMTVLEGGADSVTCGKAEFSDELKETSTTLALTPSFSECTADINGTESSATVTPGSCKYELSGLQEGGWSESEVSSIIGKESIGPSGCGPVKIEVSALKCTFEIASQGPDNGTTLTPDGEEGMKDSSGINGASVTETGCTKAENPYLIWRVVAGVLRLIVEYAGLRFRFLNAGGGVITTQRFNAGEEKELQIENPYVHWPMIFEGAARTTGWEWFEKTGEKCHKAVYFPGGKCKFNIKAPMSSPPIGAFDVYGVILFRGTLRLEL